MLDIWLLPPPNRKKKGRSKKIARISSDSEREIQYDGPDGVAPDLEDMIAIDDWEKMAGRQLDEDDVDEIAGMVTWCYAKWDDLQYEQCELPNSY